MSKGTRLPFILRDIERELRGLAPQIGQAELVLPAGAFGPVMEALAGHYGDPAISKAEEFGVGLVVIKRARA